MDPEKNMSTSSHARASKEESKRSNLRLVAWEITRNCNLSCVHCRASATMGPYDGELDTATCFNLLDQIHVVGDPIIILTGGEPLLRQDIFEIARYGTDKGLRMVMAPNGTLITEDKARQMADAGIKRISISLDGATRDIHDRFRGVDGAFDGALQGISMAKKAGSPRPAALDHDPNLLSRTVTFPGNPSRFAN